MTVLVVLHVAVLVPLHCSLCLVRIVIQYLLIQVSSNSSAIPAIMAVPEMPAMVAQAVGRRQHSLGSLNH